MTAAGSAAATNNRSYWLIGAAFVLVSGALVEAADALVVVSGLLVDWSGTVGVAGALFVD
jgi:hypothetical protein